MADSSAAYKSNTDTVGAVPWKTEILPDRVSTFPSTSAILFDSSRSVCRRMAWDVR